MNVEELEASDVIADAEVRERGEGRRLRGAVSVRATEVNEQRLLSRVHFLQTVYANRDDVRRRRIGPVTSQLSLGASRVSVQR